MKIFLIICLILLITLMAKSQTVSDADRRPFENLSQIKIDVDRDGKLDTIQPRSYQIAVKQNPKRKRLRKRDIQNWVTFDLVKYFPLLCYHKKL